MFQLEILSITKAKARIARDWPTHIISIINDAGPDFGATHIDRQHDNHAIFNFHDVEDDENQDYVVPSKHVMAEILATTKMWELDNQSKLLIHCSAGKSRSTAVALGVLVQAGISPIDALKKVGILSPAMCPNRLIVQYMDELLGMNGALLKCVTDWYAAKIIQIPGLAFPNRGGFNK